MGKGRNEQGMGKGREQNGKGKGNGRGELRGKEKNVGEGKNVRVS